MAAKSNPNRALRIKSLIARNVMDIVSFELKDPNIGFVSVNEVSLNRDNSLATVYVSFLEPGNYKKRLEELSKAKGYIRTSLAKKMDLYKVPELRFELDRTLEDAKHLDELLAREAAEIAAAKKAK